MTDKQKKKEQNI